MIDTLSDKKEIVVEMGAAGSLRTLTWKHKLDSVLLSDDKWHSVHFAMASEYIRLVIDGQEKYVEEGFLVLPRLDRKWQIGRNNFFICHVFVRATWTSRNS